MARDAQSIFVQQDLGDPEALEAPCGRAVLISNPAIDKDTSNPNQMNEDAAGFWALSESSVVLALADGLGGGPAGAQASAIAMQALDQALSLPAGPDSLRGRIVDAFEAANASVLDLGIGAGTTLVVVEISDQVARPFHAGDSSAFMVGQRGRVRFETTPHSPVGYAVASGMLEPEDVHHHEERHILSNCIGSRAMHIEMGAPIPMAPFDTLVLATDGITDNMRRHDLIELARIGDPARAAVRIREGVRAVMAGRDPSLPAHPDDATILLYRRHRT